MLGNIIPVELYKKALEDEINRIKGEATDSPIAQANQNLLNTLVRPSWEAGGMLIAVDFLAGYTLDCAFALVDLTSGVKAVIFHFLGGPRMPFLPFNANIAGLFVVDPKSIAGDCQFNLVFGSPVEEASTFHLFRNNQLLGTFAGYINVGVQGVNLQGNGGLSIENIPIPGLH